MSIRLRPTKLFNVFEDHSSNRSIELYKVDGKFEFTTRVENQVKSNLIKFGCCVRGGVLRESSVNKVRKELNVFSRYLISKYDEMDDEFTSIDIDKLNITRMPRIGKGKHNIHFCPEMSKHHQMLADLAVEGHYSETLSLYMNKPCTLRETGISLTRPVQTVHNVNEHDTELRCEEGLVAGEGMEWHSDGAAGEATVLMAVSDVDESMGSLRVIPGSHLLYVPGVGHDENILKNKVDWLKDNQVVYEYRAGQPMMIDARTLHSVSRNSSNQWRLVIWFIFDSY